MHDLHFDWVLPSLGRASASLAALVIASWVLISCESTNKERRVGSAAQVVRAVEMLRGSSNHDKRLWLERLQKLPCATADVCQLRDACGSAYLAHLTAIDELAHSRRLVESSDAGDGDAGAAILLRAAAGAEAAQAQLSRARNAARECAENEAVIRQRYGLH